MQDNFGSELATITNDEENYLVYRMGIDNNVNDIIWIGYTDSKLKGNWQWLKKICQQQLVIQIGLII